MTKTTNRTSILTAYLAALVVVVAFLFRNGNPTIAGYAFAALAFLSVPPAARHAVGDLAVGGGVRGAWKALTTEAKPGEAAPPAPGSAP